MKRIAVLYSKHTPIVDAIKYSVHNCIIDCITSVEDVDVYDLIICLKKEIPQGKVISCHYSLLPAFNCEDPVKEAFLQGVKVTGITIYYPNSGQIIAQYPVFINNDTHYEDLKQELTYIEQTILPIVTEKIINNEPFEIQNLMNKKCTGSCGGCSSCSH